MAQITYDERLERLLSTAAEVFAAKGYHCSTMRDLSRALKVDVEDLLPAG